VASSHGSSRGVHQASVLRSYTSHLSRCIIASLSKFISLIIIYGAKLRAELVCCAKVRVVIGMSGRTGKWITCWIAGLDEHFDEEKRVKILEQCGRQCQSKSFIKKARSIYQRSKNIDEFLKKLSQVYKHLRREKGNVYIVYPKCYCSQANKLPKRRLSGTYCNCSRGWAKALFEGALGRHRCQTRNT